MTLKETYFNPNYENFEKLKSYLSSIGGRKLKLPSIRENIFKTKWKGRENNLRTRCQIQAASMYLSYLLSASEKDNLEGNIKTLIADIIPYIKAIDEQEDTSFILISTNNLPSSTHYEHAASLFFNHRLPNDAKKKI